MAAGKFYHDVTFGWRVVEVLLLTFIMVQSYWSPRMSVVQFGLLGALLLSGKITTVLLTELERRRDLKETSHV
jgi:hypothetical protein